ncbi:hypothetical protein HF086_006626 [Spodoptera exigua]|uniref:Uncharacterized protein n=1 Tax=Spodoptera exigua TaxID=7107 RepID=A0A922M7L1_SPOEX|nr:hypothetical protein HF086_006626 [Spodoptera exigua]
MTDQKNMEVCGSVMDGVAEKGAVLESPTKKGATEYVVYPIRWLVLFVFVFNSASNSMQWIQYTIIQDAIVKYYDVSSIQVYWTSMIYMITYIPLIFPASFLLDKTELCSHLFRAYWDDTLNTTDRGQSNETGIVQIISGCSSLFLADVFVSFKMNNNNKQLVISWSQITDNNTTSGEFPT